MHSITAIATVAIALASFANAAPISPVPGLTELSAWETIFSDPDVNKTEYGYSQAELRERHREACHKACGRVIQLIANEGCDSDWKRYEQSCDTCFYHRFIDGSEFREKWRNGLKKALGMCGVELPEEIPKERDADGCLVEKPSPAKPDTVKPDTEKPHAAQSNTEKPDAAQSNTEKPDAEKAVTETPSAEKADTEKADTEKADTEKPHAGQSNTEKPDAEKPDTEKPDTFEKADTEKPETEQPDTEKPDAEKLDTVKPSMEKLDTKKPDAEKTATETPSAENPDTKKPDTEQPNTEQPDTEKPHAGQSNTESKEAGVGQSTSPQEETSEYISEYDCHAACGGIITTGREGRCKELKEKFVPVCEKCAIRTRIWGIYRCGARAGAKKCGVQVNPQ